MGATIGRWGFAEPGPLRDELTALALAGTKTTASLALKYEIEGAALPDTRVDEPSADGRLDVEAGEERFGGGDTA